MPNLSKYFESSGSVTRATVLSRAADGVYTLAAGAQILRARSSVGEVEIGSLALLSDSAAGVYIIGDLGAQRPALTEVVING